MKEKGELIPVVKEEEQQQRQQQQMLTKSCSINSSSSNSSSSSSSRRGRRHSSSSMEERKSLSCMESTPADEIIVTKTKQEDKTSKEEEVDNDEMGPRERLKRHRREVAGQVWIPDMWGQESFLNEWIDCSSFDASLIRHNIMLARSSLIKEPHIVAPP